jgi:hypothetical protein
MGIPIQKLKPSDLAFYKKWQEEYYYNDYPDKISHTLHIGDVVQIHSDIYHDHGYANEEGIVVSLCGISNYLYVISYCKNSNRYWPCGFNEKDLTKIDQDLCENEKLYLAFEEYIIKNDFNICTEDFEIKYFSSKDNEMKTIKKGKHKEGNVIYLY